MSKIQPIIDMCSNYNGFSIYDWHKLPEFKMEIYVRRTKRMVHDQIKETIDLANCSVQERYRGKGYFTLFLIEIEEYAKQEGLTVFAECVLNEDLGTFLEQEGYSTSEHQDMCYFKFPAE